MERSADWIRQAQSDLRHGRNDLEDGFYDWACFSAQQAAEKAVKAVLQKLGAEAWGHAVADLMDELSHAQAMPAALRDAALELDKVYIPSRYPHAHPSGAPSQLYTQREAERLIGYADQIIQFCEGLISDL